MGSSQHTWVLHNISLLLFMRIVIHAHYCCGFCCCGYYCCHDDDCEVCVRGVRWDEWDA